MTATVFKVTCVLGLLFQIYVQTALGNNINIDGDCPRTGQACMPCLSRNSDEIERCQQLYFYVTFTTTSNQAEIDRYCLGDCPIILSTAYYYCGNSLSIPELFVQCPSYNVEPTGSFSVDVTFDNSGSCLTTSSFRCLECIGDGTRDAVRCLQAYLLARFSNSTSATYSSNYCNSNCPLVLNSTTWYCDLSDISADAYNFCQMRGTSFCGDLVRSTEGSLEAAASPCLTNCTSTACMASIQQFGCCLRQTMLGNTCESIPNCTLTTVGTTQNIVIDGDCTFGAHGCTQCLSRNSDELERCVQLYGYISVNRNIQSSSASSQITEFCSGECPILLLTADYFCSSRNSLPNILEVCPSYNVMPTASVDITANFSGQNCLQGRPAQCLECIASDSPEPTRCLQLYLLASEETGSTNYIDEFCTGNCPLTLGTTEWYCSRDVQDSFSLCNRTQASPNGQYCRDVTRNTTAFNDAIGVCRSNCSSTECAAARTEYGCCLSSDGQVNSMCGISTCSVQTAGAPILLTSASLIATLLSVFIYSMLI